MLCVSVSRGNVVLLHAAQYDTVPNVINLSGRFHMQHGVAPPPNQNEQDALSQTGAFVITRKGKTYRVTQNSINERLQTDMTVCRNIKRTSVLICHGSNDEMIPHSDSVELQRLLADAGVLHEFVTVLGADHMYSSPDVRATCVAAVLEWLQPRLAGIAQSSL